MTGFFSSLRDRPISEQERPRLLLIIAAGLTAVAFLLPSNRPSTQRTVPGARLATRHKASGVPNGIPTREVGGVSETFLAGYLDFIYGHASVRSVHDATPSLLRTIQAHPPRVSPAMLAAHPRVLSLTTTQAVSDGAAVRALVNDGGLADYTIRLQLSPLAGRLLVASVEEG